MKTPIRRNVLALLFFMIFSFAAVHGAAPSKTEIPDNRVTVGICSDDAFERTIAWLEDEGYFIQSVDRSSGFVHAKMFIENNKVFTYKKGELRNVSIFVEGRDENRSEIRISIYSANLTTAGTENGIVYSYDKQGLNTDEALYADMLQKLEACMNRQQAQ